MQRNTYNFRQWKYRRWKYITETEVKQLKPKNILSEKQKKSFQKGRERINKRRTEKILNIKIEASKLLLKVDYKNINQWEEKTIKEQNE